MPDTPSLPACAPLRLYDPAPAFRARSTRGELALQDFRGRWVLLFSHPADFTPVCTSEFLAFAHAQPRFEALDCALLALSVDGLFSHLAWLRDIQERFGVTVGFPVIEDPSLAIARGYGMLDPAAGDSATARAAYVIDPHGRVRAINWYPMEVGRSVEELLRLVSALQTADREHAATPEGWQPGGRLLEPVPLEADTALAVQPGADEAWYFRWRTP